MRAKSAYLDLSRRRTEAEAREEIKASSSIYGVVAIRWVDKATRARAYMASYPERQNGPIGWSFDHREAVRLTKAQAFHYASAHGGVAIEL